MRANTSIDDHPMGSRLRHADFLLVGGGLSCATAAETTASGEIAYDQLLIATGGVPKVLGVRGAALPGVFTLHHKGDADAIRRAEVVPEIRTGRLSGASA